MVVCSSFSRSANRLKYYLPELKKKQALHGASKVRSYKGFMVHYSESWLQLCVSGILYESALNPHFN